MAAILQTKGPIITHQAVRGSWRFLRHLASKPYVSAAMQLQKLNFGAVVNVGTSQYFKKKRPDEVSSLLLAHPDLCTLEYYDARFHMPTSSYITPNMRLKLIDFGIVPPDFFDVCTMEITDRRDANKAVSFDQSHHRRTPSYSKK